MRSTPCGSTPYDVTGHTLWMLMGVTVDAIDKPFDAPLTLLKTIAPVAATAPPRPKGAYLIGPESYGTFKMVTQLQKVGVLISMLALYSPASSPMVFASIGFGW